MILVIGDIHVKKNNLSEIRLFKEKLEECLEMFDVEMVVMLGDNLDKHDTVFISCLNMIYDVIETCRSHGKVIESRPVYILVGNHDYSSNHEFLTTRHWLNGLKEWENIIVVDEVVFGFYNDKKLTFVPYVEAGRFIEALNTKKGWMDSHYIFAHQEFRGAQMGAMISTVGDEWPLDFPKIISGHIHSKQQPQDNIYYPGSALQHAFGDSSPILLLLDEDEICDIDLEMPKKKILYVDAKSVIDYEIPKSSDIIKLVVSGSIEEFKQFKKSKKYKSFVKRGIKITFKKDKLNEKNKVNEKNNENNTFINILRDLVENEKNELLQQDFENIFKDELV
jgi:DNA repair exonuclease SbcCD nuclease subunit